MSDTPDDGPDIGPDIGSTPDTEYLGEIADLTQLVEQGHDMVTHGSSIDLSNLEKAIGDLCRRMAETPPADPDAVTAAIEHLVKRLSELGEALQSQANMRH